MQGNGDGEGAGAVQDEVLQETHALGVTDERFRRAISALLQDPGEQVR